MAALVLVLAGCNADGRSHGEDNPTQSGTAVSYGEPAHGTVFDGQGNSVDIGVAVGPSEAAIKIPEAQACTAAFSSGDRQVAVPIQLAETLHASASMPVAVDLSSIYEVTSDGAVSIPSVQVRWSVKYSETPQECKGSGMSSPAIRWSSATPGETNTFSAWIVLSSGVTASDPTGQDTAGRLVFNPVVTLGFQVAVPRFDPKAEQVVQCSPSDPAMGTISYIGLDPNVAVHYGCSSPTAKDRIEAETSAVCRQKYPPSKQHQTKRGTATIRNRTASEFEVCMGFGAGDVTFTPAMACAVVGLMADQLNLTDAPDVHGTKNFCATATIIRAYNDGTWLDEAKEAGCEFFGSVFADALGVVAAGATAGTGTGAVWIGVATARALRAGVRLACDGDLRDAIRNFGGHLEANREAHVARDVSHDSSKCLSYDRGAFLKKWSAVNCL